MTSMLIVLTLVAAEDMISAAGRERMVELQAVLPSSKEWEAWLETSGEVPPDFDALPDRAELPDMLGGAPDAPEDRIESVEEWRGRREQTLALLHHWILGNVPPPPDRVEAEILEERPESGALSRRVLLRFGPNSAAHLRVELLIPDGQGPFPVFMTQTNHRDWALIALRRGYLACVYFGCDDYDDTDSFLAAYPGYDWSLLCRRAWAAARCVDYLATVPQADMDQIALTGHSRNGKMSLMAAAMDERIAVVISSSSGAGGSLSARYFGEHHFGEGIENITRRFPDWFHPRWRFFVGREHKLPVDLPDLVAMVAPRACLLSIAINDPVESTWAMEKTYLAVKPVYALHEAEERLRILWRFGSHETWPAVIERYLDWCDAQFGRGDYPFPERLIHPHDWEAWTAQTPSAFDVNALPSRPWDVMPASREAWESRKPEIRRAVNAMLGQAPPAAYSPIGTYGREPAPIEVMLGRGMLPPALEKHDLMFGDYINADVYYPKGLAESGQRHPAVLWLHPWSTPHGYAAGYRRGEQPYLSLALAGYPVFCFDLPGFGRRIEEVEGFYQRYPRWSLLGQMVRDARAALDTMTDLPYVAPDRIYVVGYGLGAMVAIHLAALDDRPAGYALVCAPPPFRLDIDLLRTGGIRRWAQVQMILPQLGYFVGQEGRVPYDVDEVLGCIAPRPLLLVSPTLDREAPLELMRPAGEHVAAAYAAFGASETFLHDMPIAYNHFDNIMQQHVIAWLHAVAPAFPPGHPPQTSP